MRLSGNNCVAFVRGFLESQQPGLLEAPVLFIVQQNTALVLFILVPSCSVRRCGAQRDGRTPEFSCRVDLLITSTFSRLCPLVYVRTGASCKSEQAPWSRYRSHLERERDDLLQTPVALGDFSSVFILSCNNMFCQIKSDALIKT